MLCMELAKKQEADAAKRNSQVSKWCTFLSKIRKHHNYPHRRVTDHRIGLRCTFVRI